MKSILEYAIVDIEMGKSDTLTLPDGDRIVQVLDFSQRFDRWTITVLIERRVEVNSANRR